MDCFVTCSKGLEEELARELAELDCKGVLMGSSGVFLPPTMQNIYRANYGSRIASRVLFPLTTFLCDGKEDLYAGAREVDWNAYIRPDQTIAVDHNVRHPKLTNSLFAAQVVKDAVCDSLRDTGRDRPSVDLVQPDVRLVLHVSEAKARLYLDTSLKPLHRRGYRTKGGVAPLRENLAAGILRLAGYDGTKPLLDLFCGSGTFLVEAALIASRTPPGYRRKRWGFGTLPLYNKEEWLAVKESLDAQRRECVHPIVGVDTDKEVIRIAKENADRAGVKDWVRFSANDFRDARAPDEACVVVCNPPYGERLDEEEALIPLYRALGDYFKQKLPPQSEAFVLTGSMILSKQVGLRPKQRHALKNGGIESRLLHFPIF